MNDYNSTAIMPEDFCPHCSSGFSFVYHQGHCPKVKAKEYHRGGGLKRIEFADPYQQRWCGDSITQLDAPLIDSTKWAREVVIEESTLLEPGRYTIVLGELYRIVDGVPPGLA